MAKYLVTGGCGFIGSHLSRALVESGHDVVILDDLSTGKKEYAPLEAKLVVGDVVDYTTVERLFDGIDGCFHLAAIASVQRSVHEWARSHAANLTATVNVFQAASRQSRPIPVIYTSSAAVYGSSVTQLLSEKLWPSPSSAYGADKLGCELHGKIAWEVHGVPAVGLRLFNIYGPRQDPSSPYSGVISIFLHKIMRGEPIAIYGDGEQQRDFVYVSDVVKVFASIMQVLDVGHTIFNVCTGVPTTINHLADAVETICGKHVNRTYLEPRKGDIRISLGDPALLENMLHIKPNTSLQEGLTLTLLALATEKEKMTKSLREASKVAG